MQQTEPAAVTWPWPGRLALGQISLLDGESSAGASLVALDLAARTSAGAEMPGGGCSPPGNVLLLCSGDAIANTVRPRLDSAGADIPRVFFASHVCESGHDPGRPVTLPGDLPLLDRALAECRARLLVIDPFLAFLGSSARPGSARDMCRLLNQLAELIQQRSCAALLLRNLGRDPHGPTALRGPLPGRARIHLVLADDPHSPGHRVLVCCKNTLGPPADSLRYCLEPSGDTCRVVWGGVSPARPADLLGAEEFTALSEACAFLTALLRDGPESAADCQARAREAGIAPRTLRRAKLRLNVRSVRAPGGTTLWLWQLPQPRSADEPP
jgi:hypothetical protein